MINFNYNDVIFYSPDNTELLRRKLFENKLLDVLEEFQNIIVLNNIEIEFKFPFANLQLTTFVNIYNINNYKFTQIKTKLLRLNKKMEVKQAIKPLDYHKLYSNFFASYLDNSILFKN